MSSQYLFTSGSERASLVVVVCVAIGALLASYAFHHKSVALEPRIALRQQELARMAGLKSIYLSERSRTVNTSGRQDGRPELTLSLMEDIIRKTLVGGRLSMLKPSLLKQERGKAQSAIDVRLTSVPLGEAVSFMKALEANGLSMKKLTLTVQQSQTTLDLSTMITMR
jgi:hypothetical protein